MHPSLAVLVLRNAMITANEHYTLLLLKLMNISLYIATYINDYNFGTERDMNMI